MGDYIKHISKAAKSTHFIPDIVPDSYPDKITFEAQFHDYLKKRYDNISASISEELKSLSS